MHRLAVSLFFPALVLAIGGAACGSSQPAPGANGGPGPMGSGVPGEAVHAAFPSMIYQGGTLVTAPKVVTVTFPGDAMAADLATFGQTVTSSTWWDTIRAGYCGANGTSCVSDGPQGVAAPQSSPPNATTYSDSMSGGPATLQDYFQSLFTAGSLPAPDGNSIYVFYFPASVTINFAGGASCKDFDGYHNAMTVGAQQAFYAIVPECPPDQPPQAPTITTLQQATLTASHEIAEATTDGSATNIGYYLDMSQPSSWGWNDIEGGEIADVCVDFFGLGNDHASDGTYTVQRIWSISRASAYLNPCIPIPSGEVYFNATPSQPLVELNVGESATITVTAFSDATAPEWTLTAADFTDPMTQYLSFSIPGGNNTSSGAETQVNNGSKVELTVTLLADPANTISGEGDAVLLSSNGDLKTATRANYWPFVVLTPAEARDAGVTSMSRARRSDRLAHGEQPATRRFSHPSRGSRLLPFSR